MKPTAERQQAGKRIVSVPELLLPDFRTHLNTYAGEGDEGLVFIGPKGAQLQRTNFTRTWSKAISAAKLTGFHFHDLRHTGNTFVSQSGATLRELMNRMGHSTTRAALIYQHTAMERDRAIADALGKPAKEALSKEDPDGSGT
ncbi:hypothetical protein GCM10023194_67520 [Planotetraspora phitsanulokensis]|uniref:Tyr recombinase domain-containing protein n=2 Tax=Planotetraspora phitsanulokensis TaxID=575192 RepID=A0A8J3U7H3_9ACTN|nr:tyrosine-type recombinase/integrase [Planotetraspora phitsanulokensis]GII39685.1 hypothetical protein Pph01_46880 [Planotetraspora phitsanulokensis]